MSEHSMDCARCAGLDYCDCGLEGIYLVLGKPKYEKTGKSNTDETGAVFHWYRVEHTVLGTAWDMTDALKKWPRNFINGYSPVLQLIGA